MYQKKKLLDQKLKIWTKSKSQILFQNKMLNFRTKSEAKFQHLIPNLFFNKNLREKYEKEENVTYNY
jgi:hypothetical protein